MNLFKKIATLLTLTILSYSAVASVKDPAPGKEYEILAQAQPTDVTGTKIEVLEFFFYTCPHCNVLDPEISAWAKKQGNDIVFRRVPVDFGQGQLPLRRLFYTLEAMGKLEELNSRVFSYIHQERKFIGDEKAALTFAEKNGIDGNKYTEVANSFTVETKMRRAQTLQNAYNIDGVPVLFVDGRYKTSPSQVMASNSGLNESASAKALLNVLDVLVAKAKKDHVAKK